jgi:hypothetical protein
VASIANAAKCHYCFAALVFKANPRNKAGQRAKFLVDQSPELRALTRRQIVASAHARKGAKPRPTLFGRMKKLRVPNVGKHFGTPGGVRLAVGE